MLKKSRRHHRTEEDTPEDTPTKDAPAAGTNEDEDEEKAASQSRRKHRHRHKEVDPIKASRRKSKLCIGETLGQTSDDDDDDNNNEDTAATTNDATNDVTPDEEVKKRRSKRKQTSNPADAEENTATASSSYIDACDIEVEIPRPKTDSVSTTISADVPTTTAANAGKKESSVVYQRPHLARPQPPSRVSRRPSPLGITKNAPVSPLTRTIQISSPPDSSPKANSANTDSKDTDSILRKTRSNTMLRTASGKPVSKPVAAAGDDDLSFVPATDTASGGNVFTAASEYSPQSQSLLTPRTFYVSRLATDGSRALSNHAENSKNGEDNGRDEKVNVANGRGYNEDCSECCWRKYMEYKAISYLQKLEEFYSARSIAIVETEGLPQRGDSKQRKKDKNGGSPSAGLPKLSFGGGRSSDGDTSSDTSSYSDDDIDDGDDGAFVDGFRDSELATNFEDPFNFVKLEDVVEPDDIWEELRTGPPLLTRTLITDDTNNPANINGNSSEESLRHLRENFLTGTCSSFGRPTYSIQSGSLNRLVQCLTPEDGHPDPAYVAAFMLTYPRFTTTSVLINKLIARYLAPKQEAPPRRVMVRAGVLSAVAALLLAGPQDLSPADTRRLSLLVRRAYADGYEAECSAISEASRAQQLGAAAPTTAAPAIPRELSMASLANLGINDVGDSVEYPVKMSALSTENIAKLADQMCLIDGDLYGKIEPREFLVNWEAPKNMAKAAGIRAVTRRFNAVSVWATSIVIQSADARSAAIEALVRLADALRERANYQALNAVVSGLTRGCIAPYVNGAFKKSAAGEVKSKFQELRELMTGTNWIKEAGNRNPPMIPFLGKYQTDIFRIVDTLQDTLQDGQINFKKQFLLYQAIREALRGKGVRYSFARVPSLHFYALSLPERVSEEQLDNYVVKK